MSFMKPEIYRGSAHVVETSEGIEIVPVDVAGEGASLADLAQYCDGKPIESETRAGVLARLSASGYLDCTPWGLYDDVGEAKQALADMYGDDEDEDEDEDDDAPAPV